MSTEGDARFGEPFVTSALRVLGDGRGNALLTNAAEIIWWCPITPHSPPVLARLIDPRGGSACWSNTRPGPDNAERRVAGPLLCSSLHDGVGRLECIDGLIGADDNPAHLIRLIRALDGPLDIEHVWDGAGLLGLTVPVMYARVDGQPSEQLIGTWRIRLTGPAGVWRGFVINASPPAPWRAEDQLAALRASLDDVEGAIASALLPRARPDRTRDALRVLHCMTWHPTGAVIAAPTTSLPEALGGNRTYDYRYSWLRDSAVAVSVASLLGLHDTAESFLTFAIALLGDDPMTAPPVATVQGEPVPEEHELNGVGWPGWQPVRIGNGARAQIQHDALGLFCEAASVLVLTGGVMNGDLWRCVAQIADGITDLVLRDALEPSSGVWEFRTPALLVSEDIGRWVALDRAIWLARGWRPTHPRRRWIRARRVVRERVMGALCDDGSLPTAYQGDLPGPDAAALLIPVLGLERNDPRVHRMVDRILHQLGAGPHLYRYPPGEAGQPSWDGFNGQEATFVPVSALAISALATIGRPEEATRRLDQLCATLPRLIPEMIHPADGTARGNTPLLWSHMELVRALYLLDTARLRQRYGDLGLALWRVARYLRIRFRKGGSL